MKQRDFTQDVFQFRDACGELTRVGPSVPSDGRRFLCDNLIREEYAEFMTASLTRDMVGVADALADLIYVCIWTALEWGIPIGKVWDEVQRTNLAKIGADGKFKRRASDGKIQKPDGWTPPDIAGVLGLNKTESGELPVKPHRGNIRNWYKWPTPHGLGYMIVGVSDGHPKFAGHEFHTSYVVKHEGNEIETRNSRYTLIGPELTNE